MSGQGAGGAVFDLPSRTAADAAMDRYSRGDDAAFSDVYDAIAPCVFAYLRRQADDRSLAEDLLQQTFMHVHRGRGMFLQGAAVLPWAFAIARRLAIDAMRREKRRPVLGGEAEDLLEAAGHEPAQDDVVAARELEASLRRTFEELPESQRVAFSLTHRDGLSFREAAEVLGTTVAAVKLRAQRASAALRAAVSIPTRRIPSRAPQGETGARP
jgi:RNA polymerase sigma-70 factor (ECF subfamily)